MDGKFRLGPIVGYTDDHSTRILIEVNSKMEIMVLCIWKKEQQIIHQEVQFLKKNNPFLFVYEKLESDTVYTIDFQIVNNKKILDSRTASVKTLKDYPKKIVVLSCNGNDIPKNWKCVNDACPDWILHIGDQVYMDSVYFKSMLSIHFDEETVEDDIRNHYVECWNRPSVFCVLSHFPNIMLYDDHDLCIDSMFMKNHFFNQKRHDKYIQIAKRIMHEYQTALVPSFISQSVHCHTRYINFGHEKCPFAILMVDFRTHHTYNQLLSKDQKKWIHHMLESSQANRLTVITPNTIALPNCGDWTKWILSSCFMDDDMVDVSPKRVKHVQWLLQTLKKWKDKKGTRKLIWIAGDLHAFQQAEIYCKNQYLCPYYVSSPITSIPIQGIAQWYCSWISNTFGFTNYGPFSIHMKRQRFQQNFLLLDSDTLTVKTYFF